MRPQNLRVSGLSKWRLIACALLAFTGFTHARSAPDAGSLLRESAPRHMQAPELPRFTPPRILFDFSRKVVVARFEVTGSTVFDAARFDALLHDLVGKPLGFGELEDAADRVATLYRTSSIHASAHLPEQPFSNGVVRIVVVEGHFGKVRIDEDDEARGRLPITLVERMLSTGQTAGGMLDTAQLERATLIADDVPGVHVSSALAAGEQPGNTDIVVKIEKRPMFSGTAAFDNADVRATGVGRATAALSLAGPVGFGDVAQVVTSATLGKQYLRGSYDFPLGANGLRGSVNASSMHFKLRDDFAAVGGSGTANTAGAALAYPVLRSADRNLYATAAFDHKHLVNDALPGNLSDKKDTSVTMGLNGDATDSLAGGGAVVGAIAVTTGRIDLSGNAADLQADQAGVRSHGRFSKVSGSLGRLQRVSDAGAVWLSVNGQVAGKNLDSGEKFSLGGANGVRAYPALEGSGDQGFVATAEYRLKADHALQLSAFYDYGRITRERNPWPTSAAPNGYSLQGVGVGLDLKIQQATLRVAVAARVGHNPAALPSGADSDGTKRSPRLLLALAVPF